MTRITASISTVLLAVPLIASVPRGGKVLYVDDDAAPGGDGQSWQTADMFLQDALFAALDDPAIVEIRVAQGTYKPDRDEAGNVTEGDRDATFQLVNGVDLLGGFAGIDAPDPDARDPDKFVTVLSGDLLDNDDPEDWPYGPSRNDNAYHVVTGSGTDQTALLDGFIITAGNTGTLGGGMLNEAGSPTVSNCMFVHNTAQIGGGMYNSNSSAIVSHCTFTDHVAGIYGSGIANDNGSTVTVTSCVFSRGSNYHYGAGMSTVESTATVVNCVFNGNRAHSYGAAMYVFNSDLTIVGCLFVGNTSNSLGGGVYAYNSSVTATNCTFGGNNAYGFLSAGGGISTLINCVLWGNTPTDLSASAVASYCDIGGGWPGDGNINADPLFTRSPDDGGDGFGDYLHTPEDEGANDDFGDLHLLPGSPCIDAGDNTAVPKDITTDLDGNPRFVDDPGLCDLGRSDGNPVVDLGVFEFQMVSPLVDCNANGVTDTCDIADGVSSDCNANVVPDECDIDIGTSEDCNGNGVPDSCDIDTGTSEDCNGNGVPDDCIDLEDDCNANGVPDECDIADGVSSDLNENGVPDECEETDCNRNGVPDLTDVADGTSQDCNANLVPDECDIANGTSEDFNGNGIPDECDGCPDVDGSGEVTTADLLLLLFYWGPVQPGHPADFNGDGNVDTSDLLELLAHWGLCPK